MLKLFTFFNISIWFNRDWTNKSHEHRQNKSPTTDTSAKQKTFAMAIIKKAKYWLILTQYRLNIDWLTENTRKKLK